MHSITIRYDVCHRLYIFNNGENDPIERSIEYVADFFANDKVGGMCIIITGDLNPFLIATMMPFLSARFETVGIQKDPEVVGATTVKTHNKYLYGSPIPF